VRRSAGAAALLFFIALAPAAALAQTAPTCLPSTGKGGILTGLANEFSSTTAPWATTAIGYAQDLFFLLVAIEIAWSGITYVLQKDSLPDFVAALLLKLLSVGFFYIVIQPQYGPVWISDIVASFVQAASAIGGQSQFLPSDPSAVFNCGTDIANAMLQSLSENNANLNLGNILPAIEACFTGLLCALGVVIAFAIIAGQLLITLIESYIVIGAGVFMLGFTGSRWTLVFGEKYVGYAFSVGIKLFMLELIVGLGFALGTRWAELFGKGIAPPEVYLEVVGAALIFAFIAWQIPSLAAALMNGSPNMTLGSFLNTAGSVAVGGVVLGSGAAGILGAGRATSSANLDALRAASEARGPSTESTDRDVFGSASASATANGRARVDPAGDLGSRRTWDESEAHAAPASGAAASDSRPFDDEAVDRDGAPEPQEPRTQNDDSQSAEVVEDGAEVVDSVPTELAGDASDSTEAAVSAEALAQTRASDAALAQEDERMARHAEEADAQTDEPGTTPSPPASSVDPRLLRRPPVPDDSAEGGSIHIRFKHPE
jgi:type IV secretion system protein TrbL